MFCHGLFRFVGPLNLEGTKKGRSVPIRAQPLSSSSHVLFLTVFPIVIVFYWYQSAFLVTPIRLITIQNMQGKLT